MHKKLLFLTPIFSLILGCSNSNIEGEINDEFYDYNSIKIKKPTNKLNSDFSFGVDISSIHEVEKYGGIFYDKNGHEKDVFSILKDNGINSIRMKLFNDPYDEKGNDYGAGINDINIDLEIAKRAKKYGMSVCLDFHYSDFWADPAHQTIPKMWQNSKNLVADVYDFTFKTLNKFKDNEINISSVQLGNEIHNGLLWDEGKVDYKNYDASLAKISKLLNAANTAVKNVYPKAKSIIHVANANNRDPFMRFLNGLNRNNVQYDVIGASYYPKWHGKVTDVVGNLNFASKKLHKQVMVMESSYAYTLDYIDGFTNSFGPDEENKYKYDISWQGQADLICEIIDELSKVNNQNGIGFYYWEAAWLPIIGANAGTIEGQIFQSGFKPKHDYGNGHANQNLFSYTGKVLPSLQAFKLVKE